MAAELPDDPRKWPDDPYELLGAEAGATETDLKGAYTRLIRRFKPEHHPDQFRRIREAYEAALQSLKWRSFFLPHIPSPAPETSEAESKATEENPTESPAPEPESASTEPLIREQLAPPSDPVAEAWGLATAGNTAEAYSRLVEQCRLSPESAEIALRLYWLLAVQPALDEAQTRHHWLATALTRSRLTGPAIELYRRELEVNPEAALSGPYTRLLECEAAPRSLLWAARQRLTAAGLTRSWMLLEIDLQTLSQRVGEFDESAWLGYLVGAMGFLTFDRSHAARAQCVSLLANLQHLQLRESWAFDQLDEQDAIATTWWRGLGIPEPMRDVIRDAWVGPAGAWRRALYRATSWVLEDPANAIRKLDLAAANYDARPMLEAYDRLLSGLPQPSGLVYPQGVIRGLVRQFLATTPHSGYQSLRLDLLRFLVNEAINPDELLQASAVDPHNPTRTMLQPLQGDGVLRLVWLTATAGRI